MMKQQILTMMVLFSTISIANAQTGNVGINTITPQATLDVTGVATDPLKLDGIIAPRLTGNELAVKTYTPTQTGAIVYATAAPGSLTGQVINVSAPGYYYFDGTVWQTFKGTASAADINIYKDNGTLTSNRTMTMAGNILTMNNAGTSTVFNQNFGESRITNTGANRATFSAFSGGSALDMYVDNGGAAQVVSSGTSTGLTVGTNNATNLSFYTNGGEKATLTSAGNFGIATTNPTERLDVGTGNVRIRDINTVTGSSSDKIVVADATGVLKTLSASSILAASTTNSLASGGAGNNTITSTVNGVASSTTAVKTVSNTSTGNTLSTTVNGVIGTTVPIINSNALSLSGTNLTSTVNGVASNSLNLAPVIAAATTHTLSMSGNTLTSNVNGIAPTVSVITSNTLTKPTTNTLVSTVNGVASAPATVISNVSNTLTGSLLTTTVNGVTGAAVDLSGLNKNIYNTDDTFTSNRTASMSGRWLWFEGSSSNTSAEKISIGSISPALLNTNVRLNVEGGIQFGKDTNYGVGSIFNDATGEKYGLTQTTGFAGSSGSTRIYTSGSSIKGNITFGKYTSATAYTSWVLIDTQGRMGIGTTSPTENLDVVGNIRATGSLISGTTTYPDYVFENYYKGFSNINPNYTFKKLNEVEEFIKEKGHLPGYASIDEVKKNDMAVDITQNSITNMEKIEELYLHVIEQSKQIEKLQKEIEELKSK